MIYIQVIFGILAVMVAVRAAILTPVSRELGNKTDELLKGLGAMLPAMIIVGSINTYFEDKGSTWAEISGSVSLLVGAILWYQYTQWRRNVNNLKRKL